MDHIGETVLEVGERVRRAQEERYAAMPNCRDHEGRKAHDCPECETVKQERQKREWEAQRAEAHADVVAQAEESFARFPQRWHYARADHPDIRAWAASFADANQPPRGLLLLGPTGVGKTWQAYGALRAACLNPIPIRAGYRRRHWRADSFADLMASLRPRQKADSETLMKELKSVDLLLVDDLAAAKGSEWVEEQTYRLINGRYEAMLPTIFTTNLAVSELREAIGDRIASRLAETCTRVVLTGEDRRRAKPAT